MADYWAPATWNENSIVTAVGSVAALASTIAAKLVYLMWLAEPQ